MREFRFILARRALIIFLSFLVAAGAFLDVPPNTQILAENTPPASREVSTFSANSLATEGLPATVAEEGSILGSSGPPPFLQAGSGDTWTETNAAKNPTTTPSARYNHAMATTASGVFLFGGSPDGGTTCFDDTWLFNTATGTWGKITGSPSTPSARYYHAMATTPSGVLLFGGYGSNKPLDDTWLFNTATNSWTKVAGLATTPTARYQHALASTPSGVLLFGGFGSSKPLDDTWFFNTSTNSWSQVSTSPTPPARYYHAMAATPSGVLLFGGYGSSKPLDDTWLFNAATNTWGKITGSPSTPTARYAHAMAATSSGVLLFGGWGGSGFGSYLNDTWLFCTATNNWGQLTFTTSAPSARYYHAMAATSSGDLLLFGGKNVTGRLNDTWLFTPAMVPTIAVTFPTTGATWVVGENTSITWTSTDVTGPCTLDLSRNGGGTWETLTTTVPAQGTYTWTVTGAASTNCLIRVTDGTVTGTSGTFSIAAHSETVDHVVLTPATATILAGTSTNYTLIAHDTFTNTWEVTSSATYSIDPGAGGTWSTNTYTSSNAGTWTVTASYGGKSATAQLTITATLHLSAPVGGEDWIRGHAYSITWASTGVTGTTTIELSRDNGGTWETLTTTTATGSTFFWTVTAPRTAQALVRVSGSGQSDQPSAVFRLRDPQIDLLSPIDWEVWTIDSQHAVTWTSTDLDGTTLAIYLARNGVDFGETLITGVDAGSGSWDWTVSGPGTINTKVRLVGADCQDSSPAFFTITATLLPYTGGSSTLTTADPWLEISGGSGTGILWVTPLDPQCTSDPDLNRFLQQTSQRSTLFFDIGQQGLSGILTIVLHFNPQLGEETFLLYLWNGTGWVNLLGTLNPANHTFTFTIDASLLAGTPFALGGDPIAMPGISPWALTFLTLSLLSLGGWWFSRRRRLARGTAAESWIGG